MKELTVKELAERDRVAEKTVRRWIEKGAVQVRRTPGGGLRILDRLSADAPNTDKSGQSSR